MLGWEFPPFFAGGVGMVCYELTRALANYSDVEITYVMPYGKEDVIKSERLKIMFANLMKNSSLDIKSVNTMIYNYDTSDSYKKRVKSKRSFDERLKSPRQIYGENLIEEVYLYAKRVANLCKDLDFDVIHAHDWTTFPAAIMLKEITGKPIVLHVHITELNKTGGSEGHSKVLEIEREGFAKADKIIAVSNQIRNMVIDRYAGDVNKVEVIHNGGNTDISKEIIDTSQFKKNGEKIVLFAGRLTLQKGPEYFIRAAKLVLEHEPNTKFIIAGSGDKLDECKDLVNSLGISNEVIFHGFYSREQANQFFAMADVFVMPSVSEPFGLVPLEAMRINVPVIVSSGYGRREVRAADKPEKKQAGEYPRQRLPARP